MSQEKPSKTLPCKNCGKPVQISQKYVGRTKIALCSQCAETQFKITRKQD